MAVEGVVCPREVAATHAHGDSAQVHAQPALAGELRLAVEHVVARRTEHADLHMHMHTNTHTYTYTRAHTHIHIHIHIQTV